MKFSPFFKRFIQHKIPIIQWINNDLIRYRLYFNQREINFFYEVSFQIEPILGVGILCHFPFILCTLHCKQVKTLFLSTRIDLSLKEMYVALHKVNAFWH